MKFGYLALPTGGPVYPLGGVRVRHRPILPVVVTGPLASQAFDCCLDTGTDDTLFPKAVGLLLGIPLTPAPHQGEAKPVGGPAITYPYGRVQLRVSDGLEVCTWEATVGFIDTPLRWPLLGLAGFFPFFNVQFLGSHREVILTPNPSFAGQYTVRGPRSP